MIYVYARVIKSSSTKWHNPRIRQMLFSVNTRKEKGSVYCKVAIQCAVIFITCHVDFGKANTNWNRLMIASALQLSSKYCFQLIWYADGQWIKSWLINKRKCFHVRNVRWLQNSFVDTTTWEIIEESHFENRLNTIQITMLYRFPRAEMHFQ